MQHLWHLFQTGGWIMWPLLFASLLAVTIFVDRLRLYRRAATDMGLVKSHLSALVAKGDTEGVKALGERAGGALGRLLADYMQHRRKVSDAQAWLELNAQQVAGALRAHLNLLSAIVTIAPLMGLLGTVTGMIQAFDVLSISEGQPFAITGGVAEALVATAFGLLIAIMALLLYVVLDQKASRLIAELEEGCGLLLISEPDSTGAAR